MRRSQHVEKGGEGPSTGKNSMSENLSRSAEAVGMKGRGLEALEAVLRRVQGDPVPKFSTVSFIQYGHYTVIRDVIHDGSSVNDVWDVFLGIQEPGSTSVIQARDEVLRGDCDSESHSRKCAREAAQRKNLQGPAGLSGNPGP